MFLFQIRPSARRGLKFTLDRHLRSKRRCSCVLQFTRLHAVSCVLHRPTSRVIHHSRLIFLFIFLFKCFYTLTFFCLRSLKHYSNTIYSRVCFMRKSLLRVISTNALHFKSSTGKNTETKGFHKQTWN